MNKKIVTISSIINLSAVLSFSISMLFSFDFGSYFSSMFIAFSFVVMMCGFAFYADKKKKIAGYVSAAFSSVYIAIILLVYFAQLTTVRTNSLTPQADELLNFQKMGLIFNYDLLGYALMALSTFFAGLTIVPRRKSDKCLKALLMIHGVFFISCLIVPMLGIFQANGPKWIGIALLEFWCLYFCQIGILSALYFSKTSS